MISDPDFLRLRALLSDHVGPDNGITIGEIQTALLIHERRHVEELLQLHIADFGFVVVAGATGFFRPTDPDQINHYIRSNESRIKCLATKNRSVKTAAAAEGWRHENGLFVEAPRQLELTPGEPAHAT